MAMYICVKDFDLEGYGIIREREICDGYEDKKGDYIQIEKVSYYFSWRDAKNHLKRVSDYISIPVPSLEKKTLFGKKKYISQPNYRLSLNSLSNKELKQFHIKISYYIIKIKTIGGEELIRTLSSTIIRALQDLKFVICNRDVNEAKLIEFIDSTEPLFKEMYESMAPMYIEEDNSGEIARLLDAYKTNISISQNFFKDLGNL